MTLLRATIAVAVCAIPVLAASQSSASAPFTFGNGGTESTAPFAFGDGGTTSQGTVNSSTGTDNPLNFGTVITSTSAGATSGHTITYSVVTPKAPVATITVPGGYENQVLVGSLIGTASSIYTLAIACADGTNPSECSFNPPVTVTAGPSTYHYQIHSDSPYTFEAACSFSSAGGSCINTDIGAYSGPTPPPSGRQTATKTFDASYLTKVQVYVTAGQTSGLVAAANGATSTVRSVNVVPTLVPNAAAAAGLAGLAALLF